MDQKTKLKIEEIIRVNHAGELGAQDIYNNQIRFCKSDKLKKKLMKISSEEKVHFDFFNEEILKRRVRPTIMSPVWKLAGVAIGAVTTRLGSDYVNACTEAVEEVIVNHYKEQIKYLEKNKIDRNLKSKIVEFCKDEENHKVDAHLSLEKERIGVKVFKRLTKGFTRVAIEISKKL